MFIIITGNPVDGFSFYGPYEEYKDASKAVESIKVEWWIAELGTL